MTSLLLSLPVVWALLLLLPSSSLATNCDEYAYPAESTSASKLTPNTFHKLCPSKSSLGYPICGDGTPFSFYYTSPVQRRSSNKVLIEFLGGGACWDTNTCGYNSDMLTFPYQFDDFLGLSCSEIAAGMAGQNNDDGQDEDNEDYQDMPINMLCAQQIGDTDFRDYHTIIVPYCTQDTHMGSNTLTYENGNTVHHRGGANMLSVLEWVYSNFPHPDQIVLTGCSAGATALPVAYDLMYHHYNSWTKGKTEISTLLDSPVYLTPEYFLESGLPNWNVGPLLKKIRFDYSKYDDSEDFSSNLINHVLKRGSKKNQFGLITHTSDPVSLAYYQAMSVSYGDDDGRRLEDNQDADEEQWWYDMYNSIDGITSTHENVDSFFMESEGHCSFGLYYALLEGGASFQEWAGTILAVSNRSQNSTGRGWFWISALFGCSLVGATIWHQRRVETKLEEADPHEMVFSRQTSIKGAIASALKKTAAFIAFYAKDAPVTIAYSATVTIYFIRIMTWDGIELFLYNPSLGPSAATLSAFGINNPTLVVYQYQVLRVLFTSSFLCSGLVTYTMVLCSLYFHIRRLERTMRAMCPTSSGNFRFASTYFVQVAALVSIGSNLVYAMLASGASCSSLALVLGLQAFSCTMHYHYQRVDFPRPMVATFLMFLFASVFMPYNSSLMMATAMLLGVGLAVFVFWVYVPCSVSPAGDQDASGDYASYAEDQSEYTKTSHGETQYTKTSAATCSTSGDISQQTSVDLNALTKQASATSAMDPNPLTLLRRNRPLQALLVLFIVMLILMLAQIRRPNRMYEQPFLTGCDLVYTANVDEISRSFIGDQFARQDSGGNNGDGGDGEEEEEEEAANDDDGAGRNRKRQLDSDSDEDDDGWAEEQMCAQVCVPHLVSRVFLWGANSYAGFDVQRGVCEDVGYSQHIADKTFSYKSYSVDVEVFVDGTSYAADDDDADAGDEE